MARVGSGAPSSYACQLSTCAAKIYLDFPRFPSIRRPTRASFRHFFRSQRRCCGITNRKLLVPLEATRIKPPIPSARLLFPDLRGNVRQSRPTRAKSRFCDWQIEARSPWRGGWPARRASRLGARRMFAAYQGGPFVEVFTPQVRLRRETPSLDDTRVSRRPRPPCSTRGKISDWCPGKVRDPRGGTRRTPPRPLERRSRLPRVGPERDRDPSRWSSVVQSASRPRLGARRGCDADSSSDVSRVPPRVDSPPDPRRALLSRAFLRAR